MNSYNKGMSVEFNGKRDLKTMKGFALRAVSTFVRLSRPFEPS